MLLHTLLHISDLHMARVKSLSLRPRKYLQAIRRFKGLLGHSEDCLADLRDFLFPYSQDLDAHLIVTGDITGCGHPDEFELANQYLGSVIPLANGDGVGLEVSDWRERAIPGNHDHWPGLPIPLGPSRSALQRYFPNFPHAGPLIRPGLRVRLLRINTDAEVGSFSRARILGRGRFEKQLDSLKKMINLTGAEQDELRVLCLHHSPTYRRPSGALEIEEESRLQLQEFVFKYRISVLLCGHIHDVPLVGAVVWDRTSPEHPAILEARCGTTTQRDPTIERRRDLEGKVDTNWHNSLFVHKIIDQDREILWQTQLFLMGRGGFLPSAQIRTDTHFPTEWKVWPWPPEQRQ